MDKQTEYEAISAERERATFAEFALFINRQFRIQGGIPVEIRGAKSTGANLTAPQSDPIEDDTDAPDEDDKVTFKRIDKSVAYHRAVVALLTNNTIRAAAKQVGISVRQLSRWRNDSDFQALLEKTRREIYSQATVAMKTQLTKSGLNAVRTLQAIADDKEASDTARVQAAAKLATFVLQVQEIENIEARLLDLEKVGKDVADTSTFTKIKKG